MPTPIGRDKPLPEYIRKEEEKREALLAEKQRREKMAQIDQEMDQKDAHAQEVYWEQEMRNARQNYLNQGLDPDTALNLAQEEIDKRRAAENGYSR